MICKEKRQRGWNRVRLTGRVGSLGAVPHPSPVRSSSVLDKTVRPTRMPRQTDKDRASGYWSAETGAEERERRGGGKRGQFSSAQLAGTESRYARATIGQRSTPPIELSGKRDAPWETLVLPRSLLEADTSGVTQDGLRQPSERERAHPTHALPSSYPGWFRTARMSFLTASYDPGSDMSRVSYLLGFVGVGRAEPRAERANEARARAHRHTLGRTGWERCCAWVTSHAAHHHPLLIGEGNGQGGAHSNSLENNVSRIRGKCRQRQVSGGRRVVT